MSLSAAYWFLLDERGGMTVPDAISDLGGTTLYQKHLHLFTGSQAAELPAPIIGMLPHGASWLFQGLRIGQALPPRMHAR